MDITAAQEIIQTFIDDEVHNAAVDGRDDSDFLTALAEMIDHGSLQETLSNWNRVEK